MLRFILIAGLMVFVLTSQVSASGRKDPAIAGFLSAVILGGGQFYNGQPGKALIPITGTAAFVTFVHLAAEDGASFSLYGSYDPAVDNDDFLAPVGVLIVLTTQTYDVINAINSANKINRQRQFGHLIEFEGVQTMLGVDPVASRNKLGAMLTLRF